MFRSGTRPARLAALIALTAAAVLNPVTASAAESHQPVVFVHGWSGASWNWAYFEESFAADGWADEDLWAWDYDSSLSNVVIAEQLADQVDEVLAATGASEVDLVTHSMGGLSSRHFLKFLEGTAQVDDWVSIGGPNHGTNAAYGCFETSCLDMRFGSEFLTNLNAGDETPSGADYATFWSPCDEVINPDSSTIVEGATNTRVSCIGHLSLLGSAEVYSGVRDFVA